MKKPREAGIWPQGLGKGTPRLASGSWALNWKGCYGLPGRLDGAGTGSSPGRPWSLLRCMFRAGRSSPILMICTNSRSRISSTTIWFCRLSLAGVAMRPRRMGSMPPEDTRAKRKEGLACFRSTEWSQGWSKLSLRNLREAVGTFKTWGQGGHKGRRSPDCL